MRALCICPAPKLEDYFENVFSNYQKELSFLFSVYTEEEIRTFFTLFMKLYTGIECLESMSKDSTLISKKENEYE